MGDLVLPTILTLALVLLWREVRRLSLQGATDALRITVLTKRVDLLTKALREHRDRWLEETTIMTEEELDGAKENATTALEKAP